MPNWLIFLMAAPAGYFAARQLLRLLIAQLDRRLFPTNS